MTFFKCLGVFVLAMLLFCAFRQKELTWLAIGDSITYLNDHTNETGKRVSKGYLCRVKESIPGLRYINKGFNGWTAGGIAERADSLGLVKADIYSVFLGTNDWWQGRPVGTLADFKAGVGNATFNASFRVIIDKIRSLNPQAKIVLITPLQRVDFIYINDPYNNAFGSYKPKNGQYLEAFVSAIDSIGRYEHIPVIDLYHSRHLKAKDLVNFKRMKDSISGRYVNYSYPKAAAIPFHPATDEYPYPAAAINLTYDGLHPSDKGNAVIADAIVKQFNAWGIK